MPAGKRLYRIYYNTYSDEVHERVKRALSTLGNVVDHPSRVHPEFRFVELLVEEPGLEDKIRSLAAQAGVKNVKVDYIDTTR